MFGSAFREFETDPFFDFGNSPFRRHSSMLEASAQHQHRSRTAAAGNADPQYAGALVPASRRPVAAVESADDAAATQLVRGSRPAAEQPHIRETDDRRRQLERYDQGEASRSERRVADRRGFSQDDFAMAPYAGSMLGNFGFASFEQHFNQMLGGMQRMMADMGDRMRQMEEAANRDDFDGHLYSHTSVYSRRYDGEGGEPHVYQAMSEMRAAPGGVRETRRAVRDTRAQEERAAHGRHIGARGHVVERRRNMQTGDGQEDHKFSGIGEDEAEKFDSEWRSRARAALAVEEDRQAGRRRQRALADGGDEAGRAGRDWRRPALASSSRGHDAGEPERRGGRL